MDSLRDLCRTIDNTLLRQDVSVVEVEEFISRSVEARFRTVVVPPWMVAHAVSMTENSETGVSVVVGFPLGYHPLGVKLTEIDHYMKIGPGVTDFDVVLNLSALKSGMWDYVESEIRSLSDRLSDRVFKLIVETPLLSEYEIRKIGRICAGVDGLDYVKTSSGFCGSPTTEDQVRILAETMMGEKRIKVSGGVRSMADLERFVVVGGDVFGTSSGLSIIKETCPVL